MCRNVKLFLDLGDTGSQAEEKCGKIFWSCKVFATKNHQNLPLLAPTSWLKTCKCWEVLPSECCCGKCSAMSLQDGYVTYGPDALATALATNSELNQRLQQALKHNEELEAKIQDLQKRLSEAEEPKDGKAQIQLDESSNGSGILEIHPVWVDVSEYLEASDLRNLSFSEKHDMLRKFFKTQLKLRDEKRRAAEKKDMAALDAMVARAREVLRRLRQWKKNLGQIWPQSRQWKKNVGQIWPQFRLSWQGRSWQGDCRVSVHADEFAWDARKPKRCNKKMRKKLYI